VGKIAPEIIPGGEISARDFAHLREVEQWRETQYSCF